MGTLTAAPPQQQAERRNYTRNDHAPKFARTYVRMQLGEWRLQHMADPLELVADELVTNAVRHSTGLNVMLWLVLTEASILVHVWDSNPEPPVFNQAEELDENGRGLTIVTALSAQRGFYPFARGKTVWAEVMR